MQSRYYDPAMHRFLNADGQLNDGILGNNLFAYCENNPVNMVDPSGMRPGDLFLSVQEAVKFFAIEYYNVSLYIRMEIVSSIYAVSRNNRIYYSYTQYTVGSPHSANPYSGDKYIPKGAWRVAVVHTHPNSNSFSNADKDFVKSTYIPLYVVTPNMSIRVYHDTRRGFKDELVLSGLRPWKLTHAQMYSLKSTYQFSWDYHTKIGCDFGCNAKNWPAW